MPNVVIENSNAEAGMYQRITIGNVNCHNNDYLVDTGMFSYRATSASGYPKEEGGNY